MDLTSVLEVGAVVPPSIAGGLAIAFALGVMHAFDADHVMALSIFATRERGAAAGARAGLRWSLGHGAVLLVVGSAMIGLGRAMPEAWSVAAERLIGLVMIGLGVYVWRELAGSRAHLHFHAHDGLAPHAHWHAHTPFSASAEGAVGAASAVCVASAASAAGLSPSAAPRELIRPIAHAPRHQHEHGAVFVGALHGFAGSAPLLVVLPLATSAPVVAISYLVVFGLGVALAMVGVSGLLGHLAGRLSARRTERSLSWLRGIGAGGSVAIGAWLAFVA